MGSGYRVNPRQKPQNGKNKGFLPLGDQSFIQNGLQPYFGIAKLQVGWSDSKAKYPDLWCETGGIPRIVVTKEWQRQNTHERRKRLVHEAIHIGWKKNHGIIDGLQYSTYPAKDQYSMAVYRKMLGQGNPTGKPRITITQAIKQVLKEFAKEAQFRTGKAINEEGSCTPFANAVVNLIEPHLTQAKWDKLVRSYHGPDFRGHCWIEYKGRVYDAETPNGVAKWTDFPYFKRQMVKQARRR